MSTSAVRLNQNKKIHTKCNNFTIFSKFSYIFNFIDFLHNYFFIFFLILRLGLRCPQVQDFQDRRDHHHPGRGWKKMLISKNNLKKSICARRTKIVTKFFFSSCKFRWRMILFIFNVKTGWQPLFLRHWRLPSRREERRKRQAIRRRPPGSAFRLDHENLLFFQ